MHRQLVLELLNDYESSSFITEEEKAPLKRLIKFVKENPNCFERSLLTGHLTGSAWIVDASGKKCLLTHHRKLDAWFQLGGHADGESDICQVAQKEAEEESGISELELIDKGIYDIDIHEIPQHKGVPKHTHYDIRFLLRAKEGAMPLCSSESKEVRWVEIGELSFLTKERSMNRLAEKSR